MLFLKTKHLVWAVIVGMRPEYSCFVPTAENRVSEDSRLSMPALALVLYARVDNGHERSNLETAALLCQTKPTMAQGVDWYGQSIKYAIPVLAQASHMANAALNHVCGQREGRLKV